MNHDQRRIIQAVRGHWHIHPGGESETRDLLNAMDLVSGQRMLDLGSGFGATVAFARANGLRAVGVDLLAPSLRLARRLHPGLALVAGDASALPFRDGSFDAVTAMCMVGFLSDKTAFFLEVRRVLRPGGRFGADVYTLRDSKSCLARPGGMAHVISLERLLEHLISAGFQVLAVEDLGGSYTESYRAFLEAARRARPELDARFGEGAVDDALSAFRANIAQVLEGGKGGARVVARATR